MPISSPTPCSSPPRSYSLFSLTFTVKDKEQLTAFSADCSITCLQILKCQQWHILLPLVEVYWFALQNAKSLSNENWKCKLKQNVSITLSLKINILAVFLPGQSSDITKQTHASYIKLYLQVTLGIHMVHLASSF